jgi:hypothetical protein
LIKPALDVAINSNSILRDEVVDSLTALSRRKPVINLHEEQSLSKELWKLSNQKQKTSGILIYILRLIASNYSLYDWNINGKTDLVYRSIKYRWMILAEFANTLVNGLLPHVGRNALILYTALAGKTNNASWSDAANFSKLRDPNLHPSLTYQMMTVLIFPNGSLLV